MHISELWESEQFGPKLVRAALWPLSLLYEIGWQSYRGLYRVGVKKPFKASVPVICIGNLTVGGSGKSPLVIHIADVLRELNQSVVISASGYGSPRAEAAELAPSGELDAGEWGDEPAMIRQLRPDVPIIVGRRRVLAAKIAEERFPTSCLVLDDGFQHLPLFKDLTIIIDPVKPQNPFCLPAGPYREPRSNRKLANLVLPGQFQIVEKSGPLVRPDGMAANVVEGILICALAQPEKVVRSLQEMGVRLAAKVFLPDHDNLQGGTLTSNLPPSMPILVTRKDWVKLQRRTDLDRSRIAIIEHKSWIEPAQEFKDWLQKKLDGIQKATYPQ